MTDAIRYSSYLEWLNENPTSVKNPKYFETHLKRFNETTDLLEKLTGDRVVEIGATDYVPLKLQELGFSEIWGTIFTDDPEKKRYRKTIEAMGLSCPMEVASVNLEHDFFPVSDGYFDAIVFCEVLEHLDIDPMFVMTEFNRIIKSGGKILLTTPNSASANNFWAIFKGYRPHFFTQYEKNRSPYRHNFEYDIHMVYRVLDWAGFEIEELYTKDVFYDENTEALQMLEKMGGELRHRGDDIFCIAKKIGPVRERWPSELYTG